MSFKVYAEYVVEGFRVAGRILRWTLQWPAMVLLAPMALLGWIATRFDDGDLS